MANAFPAIQITTVDPNLNPQQAVAAQCGGPGLYCPNGIVMQDAILAASTADLQLAFPNGVTNAAVIYVAATNVTDLIVKVGAVTPASIAVPLGLGMLLYGLPVNAVSLNSVLGGRVQYVVGG